MNRFFRALEAKYQAEIEEALAVFELYTTKSVGVGEHPDILTILDNAVNTIDANLSKVETLKRMVAPVEQPEQQAENPVE